MRCRSTRGLATLTGAATCRGAGEAGAPAGGVRAGHRAVLRRRLHAACACGDRCGAGGGAAADRRGGDRALSAGGVGRALAGQGAAGIRGLRAVVARDAAPDDDLRARHGPRRSSTSGSTPGPRRSSPAARREEVRRAEAPGPSRTARKALGFDELLARRRRADEEALAQLRPPPAHLDAQDPQPPRDRPHRPLATPRCAARDRPPE